MVAPAHPTRPNDFQRRRELLEDNRGLIDDILAKSKEVPVKAPYVIVADLTGQHGEQFARYFWRKRGVPEDRLDERFAEECRRWSKGGLATPCMTVVMEHAEAQHILPLTSPTGAANAARIIAECPPGMVPVTVIGTEGNTYGYVGDVAA
jgi:hypothetical protein